MPTETTLREYWFILVKRSRFILTVAVWVFLATCAITFTAKKAYQASTTFYYPISSGSGPGLDSMAKSVFSNNQSGITSLFGQTGGSQLQNYTQGILKSRAIADMMIDRFQLLDYFHIKSRESAMDMLHASTQITLDREGIMEIAVTMGDPNMAARLANGYVDAFRDYTLTSSISLAKVHRVDVQNRLAELRKKLHQAELDMVAFQAAHKTADFSDEAKLLTQELEQLQVQKLSAEINLEGTRGTIRRVGSLTESRLSVAKLNPLLTPDDLSDPILAELKRQLGLAYVNFSLAKTTETPANPEYKSYQAQVNNLESAVRRQIQKQMKIQSSPYTSDLTLLEESSREQQAKIQALNGGIAQVEKQFSHYPKAGIAFLQHDRRLKIMEALYTYLSTEYEKARLEEAKESPDFQVLDSAIPPELPTGQRKIYKLLMGLFLGLFLGVSGAFALESYSHSKVPIPETDGHPRQAVVTVEIGKERKN